MKGSLFTYQTIRETLEDIQKPCAFLHVEALEQNIDSILQMSGKHPIRIASKSIRSSEVLKMIMQYSKRFQGLMCFTAEEAIYLHEQGFDDLLIAYPTWDKKNLHHISKLVNEGAIITVMIDSKAHIEHLHSIAKKSGGSFLVAIDVDLSSKIMGLHFGVYRSPLPSVESVMEIVRKVQESPTLRLDGMMGYEAQIAGVVDKAPRKKLKNQAVRFLKKQSIKEISHKRRELMKALQKEGVSLRFVNGGGTGSLGSTVTDDHITEVTVGSGFYNSHLFDKYESLNLKPALFFATEIIRQPAKNIYTCAGGGYIASGAPDEDKWPEIYLPEGASLSKNEGAGEVQTPILYDGPITLTYGDPIIFRHSKAGELCERFNALYLIKDKKVISEKLTYRGEGKCFL